MNITFDHLQPGQQAQVGSLACSPGLARRLEDFGLVPGTCVRCRYRSPDKTLSALQVRGAVIALRRQELGCLSGRLL